MTIIYALLCPLTGGVKYVGKTDIAIGRRLAGHINECDYSRSRNTPKNIWIKSVLDAGFVPGIKTLEIISDGQCWELAEIKWIAHFRSEIGCDLLNLSDGGKGPSGVKASDETRSRISAANKARTHRTGFVVSEETKAKISATLKGKCHRIGYTHSAEARAKMSLSRTGKKASPETLAKLSAIRMGHPVSDATRKKIGAKVAAAAARKRAEQSVT